MVREWEGSTLSGIAMLLVCLVGAGAAFYGLSHAIPDRNGMAVVGWIATLVFSLFVAVGVHRGQKIVEGAVG